VLSDSFCYKPSRIVSLNIWLSRHGHKSENPPAQVVTERAIFAGHARECQIHYVPQNTRRRTIESTGAVRSWNRCCVLAADNVSGHAHGYSHKAGFFSEEWRPCAGQFLQFRFVGLANCLIFMWCHSPPPVCRLLEICGAIMFRTIQDSALQLWLVTLGYISCLFCHAEIFLIHYRIAPGKT
jgi:hypothetical protein